MKPPVVLVNGRAGRVRRDARLLERLRARLPADHVRVTQSLDEAESALRTLGESGADTLFVVGGDGTTTGTLSALLRVWPQERLPALVLTPGGTINTIPKSLGARGRPDKILARYLDAGGDVAGESRPVLRVVAGEEPARHGMIFANGAAARWLETYYSGAQGSTAAAGLVARTLASVPVGGRLAREIFQPCRARVDLDGAIDEGPFTVMGASCVRHVGLGFAPFLTAGQHPDRFHFLRTDASGARLGREIPAFALGLYRRGSCLRHASAHRVEIETDEPLPYTIDGDLFPRAARIRLEAGPLLRFLAP